MAFHKALERQDERLGQMGRTKRNTPKTASQPQIQQPSIAKRPREEPSVPAWLRQIEQARIRAGIATTQPTEKKPVSRADKPAAPRKVNSPTKALVTCPDCGVSVREDRLARHRSFVHSR